MLEIKHTEVWGLARAEKARAIPMSIGEIDTSSTDEPFEISKRSKALGSVPLGTGHDHFLLGIHVQFDIKYPQYWTIEAERYHNFEIISSQSKMHKLTAMMSTPADMSTYYNKYVDKDIIQRVQEYVQKYNESVPNSEQQYFYFMKAVSNLPMGFEMWMACDLTYLQIKTIVMQRLHHKLREDWDPFCKWAVEELPYFSELTGITFSQKEFASKAV